MSNWILKATEDYLIPVYEQLHKELLKRDVLHADEITLQVLHEPGKNPQSDSYMWLYRTSGDTDKPIVLYEYQPGRGGKHPKEFLAGYKVYLHSDDYAGYHDLGEDITVVGCWAHARRKFDEAVKSLPKDKAFHYLKEQWPYLTNYLKDGRLEISNNLAERSIKPFVIDRKNFLFANTPKGATGSVVMFSLIQTAIENGLDPYRYLTWLLKTAKNADLRDVQVVKNLLPWTAPAECHTK